MEYVNVARHAVALASGSPVAPGERCAPDLKDPYDKALIGDGLLAQADDGKAKEAKS